MKKLQQRQRQVPRKKSSSSPTRKVVEPGPVILVKSPAQLLAAQRMTQLQQAAGYDDSHHLREVKILPESLIQLQQEITLPEHRDIYNAANAEKTFETALGMIAAMCDIVLDGEYDVPKLCELLVLALRSRRSAGANPSSMHPELVAVDLIEKKDELAVEFAGQYFDPSILKQPTFDGYSTWMKEQGCEVCESRVACSTAGKCLGKESLEEGVKIMEKYDEPPL